MTRWRNAKPVSPEESHSKDQMETHDTAALYHTGEVLASRKSESAVKSGAKAEDASKEAATSGTAAAHEAAAAAHEKAYEKFSEAATETGSDSRRAALEAKAQEHSDKADEHDRTAGEASEREADAEEEKSGGGDDDQPRDEQGRFAGKLAKAKTRGRRVVLSHDTPAVKQGERRLARKLATALRAIGKAVAADVSKRAGLGKAAEEEDEADAAVARADWAPVAAVVQTELTAVARDGAKRTLATLGVDDDESITSQTFDTAVEWARARAAELVGKSWDADGELVDNPDADMAITDTLREEIRSAVADAIENGDSAADLSDTIEGLAGFSSARADLIAQTEIQRAHNASHLIAFRESGVVEKKAWSTSNEDNVCDECQGNADDGDIGLDEDFSSGDDAPPQHPGCLCVLTASVESAEDQADDNTEEEDDAAE
jgi:SPP1 gp7 family putative phage head morphogenesis protein